MNDTPDPWLFEDPEDGSDAALAGPRGDDSPAKNAELPPRAPRQDVRVIQDLIWNEALCALAEIERFTDLAEFQVYLQQHLPQNSLETRTRYTQTLIRWFFPDGIRGLAARVWLEYRDQQLAEEMLRYLYLRAEPMVGDAVAEAVYPIAENAVIPESYLPNFLRSRYGDDTPAKSIKRLKSNLRKLGFLVRTKGNRDTLRPLSPSPTGFLLVLHYLFARTQSGGIEFKTLAADAFWKYLGFKSEDQLREILRGSLRKDLIAKYLVADQIESISFRYNFEEFVGGKLRA
jgi:hypothetical protein